MHELLAAEGAASRSTPAPRRDPEVRMLVAEDDPDLRECITLELGQRWRVQGVADGLAALSLARVWRPDVVLTDVVMPGLSGYGLLNELRRDPHTHSLSVVMLSARASIDERIEGLEAGANDYLV